MKKKTAVKESIVKRKKYITVPVEDEVGLLAPQTTYYVYSELNESFVKIMANDFEIDDKQTVIFYNVFGKHNMESFRQKIAMISLVWAISPEPFEIHEIRQKTDSDPVDLDF